MGWLLVGLGVLWLLESRPGGFAVLAPPVATPGTQIEIPGTGIGLILPTGGATYHLSNGHTVTVMPGAQAAPGGWVQGMLEDNSVVWFSPATGQIYQLAPGMNF
jgi:hypothetical protein